MQRNVASVTSIAKLFMNANVIWQNTLECKGIYSDDLGRPDKTQKDSAGFKPMN